MKKRKSKIKYLEAQLLLEKRRVADWIIMADSYKKKLELRDKTYAESNRLKEVEAQSRALHALAQIAEAIAKVATPCPGTGPI